jgi:hypothetical protein
MDASAHGENSDSGQAAASDSVLTPTQEVTPSHSPAGSVEEMEGVQVSGQGKEGTGSVTLQPSESVDISAYRSPRISLTSDAGESSLEGSDVEEGEVQDGAGSTHSEVSVSSTNQRSTE